jgi:hypothetical protein
VEIGDSIRILIVFHDTCLRLAGEAEFISTVFFFLKTLTNAQRKKHKKSGSSFRFVW